MTLLHPERRFGFNTATFYWRASSQLAMRMSGHVCDLYRDDFTSSYHCILNFMTVLMVWYFSFSLYPHSITLYNNKFHKAETRAYMYVNYIHDLSACKLNMSRMIIFYPVLKTTNCQHMEIHEILLICRPW